MANPTSRKRKPADAPRVVTVVRTRPGASPSESMPDDGLLLLRCAPPAAKPRKRAARKPAR